MSACQKCIGKGASVPVPTRWAVNRTKVSIGSATTCMVSGNVMASERGSITRAVVYGITVISIHRKFHRRPSWLVNEREKKCLGIISIPAAGICWENKKRKKLIEIQTLM